MFQRCESVLTADRGEVGAAGCEKEKTQKPHDRSVGDRLPIVEMRRDLFLALRTIVRAPLRENDFFDRCLFTELARLLIEDHKMLHALPALAR